MEEYAWISAHLFLSACGWFIYIQFKFHVYYAVKYKRELCDVCRLQGFKRMSQLIKNSPDIYVAEPEVKIYTGDYKNPNENSSAFEDATSYGYSRYDTDRSNRLLSGYSKNRFNSGLKGSEIECVPSFRICRIPKKRQ